MNIAVVCIGNELLRGFTLNTNLAFLGEVLGRHGLEPCRECCIPDDRDTIARTVRDELAGADVVITVGGLGPTSDDVTRDGVAAALGLALHFDPAVLATIEAFLARRDVRVPAQALRTQAMVPTGATVLANRNGTAPGLWCEAGGKHVILLPGPPRELQPMVEAAVLPRLCRCFAPDRILSLIRVCGVPESVVAAQVEALLPAYPGMGVAYCARPSAVDVHLKLPVGGEASLAAATAALRTALGRAALPDGCESLAAAVGALLLPRAWRLATAESCTGGGIAAAITDVPGASAFFAGATVAYANEWKERFLGVRRETLAAHGAVSAETAAAMLEGLLERSGVEAGIAVTGIAGPDGGTAEKPVGTVFIATAAGARRLIERRNFPGNRDTIRQRTVTLALNQLRLELLEAARGTS